MADRGLWLKGEVHVWKVRLDGGAASVGQASGLALRRILFLYTGLPAGALRFRYGRHGMRDFYRQYGWSQ